MNRTPMWTFAREGKKDLVIRDTEVAARCQDSSKRWWTTDDVASLLGKSPVFCYRGQMRGASSRKITGVSNNSLVIRHRARGDYLEFRRF